MRTGIFSLEKIGIKVRHKTLYLECVRIIFETVSKGSRGRPRGSTGKAAILSTPQISEVIRVARREAQNSDRAQAVVALSVGLGLRASELAALKFADVYDSDGAVRELLSIEPAYADARRPLSLSSPWVRKVLATYRDKQFPFAPHPDVPMFQSQRGGHMTAASMARFLTALYRQAGIPGASSHSGRRTFTSNR
jgi:integrase/recombinase XerD